MFGQGLARFAALLCLSVCCGLCIGQTTERVYRNLAGEKLETILKDLEITFQKKPGKKAGIFSYDFEQKGTKIRLYNYGGEDLWIETDFTEKANLEAVNRWNMRAKFSRAVLVKDGPNASISLEAQIDCTLGITEGMIRQFVRNFESEIQAFAQFLKQK